MLENPAIITGSPGSHRQAPELKSIIIRYKARGKIAKIIRQEDSIILEEQKRIIVTNYYESLFRDEEIKTINI